MKLWFLLFATASAAIACDCEAASLKETKKNADIVFRGTITSIRNSGPDSPVVVFHVTRVWKGQVTATFEMLAFVGGSPCLGFDARQLDVGNELLVFARSMGSPWAYLTSTC